MCRSSRYKIRAYEKQIAAKFCEALIVNEIPIPLVPAYMGVSKQQYSKYRAGRNRIPIASLYSLAVNTGIDIKEFFPEIKQKQDIDNLDSILNNKTVYKFLKKLSYIEKKCGDIGLKEALEMLLDAVINIEEKKTCNFYSQNNKEILNNQTEVLKDEN